ncbi:MAG: hypothetical protein EPO40_08290 [Myxococcaceae bacterium]|nr:MAG: hypothetical protein EPO40_08290 [Myxococcaceae bacterium]
MDNWKIGRASMAMLVLAMTAGCGSEDPANTANTVNYSGPVSINIDKFKDGEVRNNAFDADKSVSSESGNPYGMFLSQARATLGRAPAAVLVDRVTLTLGRDSTGVTAFEQILGGPLVVYLASSSSTVNIGTVAQPTGAGPVEVVITATRDTLAPINNDLVQGSFKVGIRVPAAAALPRSFDAKVATVLYFRALAL